MLSNKKEEKILMYCTGGIRCVKASEYLRQHGFKDIYELKGGIVSYIKVYLSNNFILLTIFKGNKGKGNK